MKKERKMVELDLDTHTMLKDQAEKAKLSMRVYLRLCLIACKSDVGIK